MAETTLIELRNTHPALVNVSDDVLNQYLADAKNYVEAAGYVETHLRFSELQRYKACHYMGMANIANSNIKSLSVADVSKTYGGLDNYNKFNATNWEVEYNKIRLQIDGLCDRCL
jgi:hypothetical protein